jgi:hypothetical protein
MPHPAHSWIFLWASSLRYSGDAHFGEAPAPKCSQGCTLQEAAAVDAVDGVASRGRDGPAPVEGRASSPASRLTPAHYQEGADWGRDGETSRLVLALGREAGAHMQCVLGQYDGLATRGDRCVREGQLLGAAVARELERGYSRARADRDPAHLYEHVERVLEVGELSSLGLMLQQYHEHKETQPVPHAKFIRTGRFTIQETRTTRRRPRASSTS